MSYYRDSEYGKVADLFAKLNFVGDRPNAARPYSALGRKTSNHRKSFIETILNRCPNAPSADIFPLKYDHPDAQLCASSFLDSNHGIFQGTDHTPPGLLKYPEDKQEIINVLAKILCHQELSYRKNQAQLKKPTLNDDDDDTVLVGHDNDDDSEERVVKRPRKSFGKPTYSPLLSIDEADDVHGGPDSSYSPRAAARAQAEGPVDVYLKHNTKVHLDIAYPPVGTVEGKDGAFLSVHGSTWPEDIWPFTFRFIHEQKAYKLRSTNHVRNFVTAVKQQLRLPSNLTQDENARLSKKCGKYIAKWIGTWIDFGLLVQKGEEVFRHSYFDDKLEAYRAKWIAGVHQGSTKGVIELQPPALPPHIFPSKKPACSGSHSQDPPGFEQPSAKRAKLDPEYAGSYGGHANDNSMDGLKGSYDQAVENLLPNKYEHTAQLSNRSRATTGMEDSPISINESTAPFSVMSRQAPASSRTNVVESGKFAQTSTAHPHAISKPTNQPKNPASNVSTPVPRSGSVEIPRAKSFSSRTFSSFPTNGVNGTSLPPTPSGGENSTSRAQVPQSGKPSSVPRGPRPWWAGSKAVDRPQSVDTKSPSLPPSREKTGTTNGAPSPLTTAPSLAEKVETRVTIQPGLVGVSQAEKDASELIARQISAATDSSLLSQLFDNSLSDFAPRVSTPSKPLGASLNMIIEQAEGEMDFENPLSEGDLSVASIAGFIDCVRSRRTNKEGAIRVLKFKQRWGSNKIYVVDENTSDEAWKKVRNEIKRNFETMKDKKPERKKFEVDVLVEGDEDDGDDEDE